MEQTMTITEAFNALGVNPTLIYLLTIVCILLVCCRRINEAAGLFIMLSIPYISASTLMGQMDRITLYIPLIGAVLSVVFIIVPVTFLGKEKYAELIYEKIPSKIRNLRNKREIE